MQNANNFNNPNNSNNNIIDKLRESISQEKANKSKRLKFSEKWKKTINLPASEVVAEPPLKKIKADNSHIDTKENTITKQKVSADPNNPNTCSNVPEKQTSMKIENSKPHTLKNTKNDNSNDQNSNCQFDFTGNLPIFTLKPHPPLQESFPEQSESEEDENIGHEFVPSEKEDIFEIVKALQLKISPRIKSLVDELMTEIEKLDLERKKNRNEQQKINEKEQQTTEKQPNQDCGEKNEPKTKQQEAAAKSDKKEKKKKKKKKICMEFSKRQIFESVNEIKLYITMRMTLNSKEWEKIKNLDKNGEKKTLGVENRKISAALFNCDAIEDSANQNRQGERKKLFTLYLYFNGCSKNALRTCAKFGLTTTEHPRQIYEEELILDWIKHKFAGFKVAIEKGLFIVVFDNNYFKTKTPNIGAEPSKFKKLKLKFPNMCSKYNFKTVTLEMILPSPEFSNQSYWIKPVTDFIGDNIWLQTPQQKSAVIDFLGKTMNELGKNKSDIWFFKRIEKGINFNSCTSITLQSCMSGDDSQNDIMKIVSHAHKDIKNIFDVDVSKLDFEFACDAKE